MAEHNFMGGDLSIIKSYVVIGFNYDKNNFKLSNITIKWTDVCVCVCVCVCVRTRMHACCMI